MLSAILARIEHPLRPLLTKRLTPRMATKLYAYSRKSFLDCFANEKPAPVAVPEALKRTLWGLEFRSPILNAAGIFKQGFGAGVCYAQGAAGFLGGTCTAGARLGNNGDGIAQPFAPLSHSHAALNWLGLPNPGARQVAENFAKAKAGLNFPCGMSVAASAEIEDPKQRLLALVESLELVAQAGADFIELNESCPNTEVSHGASEQEQLQQRLAYVQQHFLKHRERSLPVVVKLSCDTSPTLVPWLVELLITHEFDGLNFGNTSTRYAQHRPSIKREDLALYDYFTTTFGGGLSGSPLREPSLALTRAAKAALATLQPKHEFHLLRTGGIMTAQDVQESLAAGASLVQWYSGYFEQFALQGHALYDRLYRELLAERPAAQAR
jgi:dihydroorotate dehydrogenase